MPAKPLRVARLAQRDAVAAVQWYASEAGESVARRFRDEISAALTWVAEHPLAGSPGNKGRRRKHLAHFPYTLYYRVHASHVTVLRIIHQHQNYR
ncbi:type II toxin-antitoxin system RelE/ParE family toxin [Chitinimonas koreensis]|uniref:type II toxin-antitoxin system RelE/ParE family toxin n=1 Tax=Chitinimonas koreensis TaxID=356302 RepID=UPI0004916114|nr:type II toxin-antitoxin system RelE/ParE family toxin [Chitinimonas koreensis]QNM98806.1 type II toxin-antitoxin system RelE/ParE family toxin [Chitinimonas koreensis]